MRIRIRLFASYREAAGVSTFELDLPSGATAADALAAVSRRHPALPSRGVLVARNEEYAEPEAELAEGDVVALIPPVSGGAAGTRERIAVLSRPLAVDDAIAAVRDDAFGAVVVFLGTVRSSTGGRRVSHLEYEAYAEMAEVKMRDIADRLEREHAPARLAMHHRVGDLGIGEVAVVVAAAAPHRGPAFAAARAGIDELKSVVPIWKKEHGEDGAVWVEDHA